MAAIYKKILSIPGVFRIYIQISVQLSHCLNYGYNGGRVKGGGWDNES